MDAKKIALYYGNQKWVYRVLLKAAAIKFNRWKNMLDAKAIDETDNVVENMTRYARQMCCMEVATKASQLHDACQAGDHTIDTPIEELIKAIDRLSALANIS